MPKWTIKTCHLYEVTPISREALSLPREADFPKPYSEYGFHGHDVPPCGGEWAGDVSEDKMDGYFVVSEVSDPENLGVADGWLANRIDLLTEYREPEQVAFDGGVGYRLVLLEVHGDGSGTFARRRQN